MANRRRADSPRPTAYGLGDKSGPEGPVDPLASLKKRVEDALLRRLGTKLAEGTLDECILEFLAKPESTRHLYEIHTAPQPPLITEVLSDPHIVELARLREFL